MAHILIIDDEITIQGLFRQFLESNGYGVSSASDGREGLRMMKQQRPDLVITDIMMPEKDGLEVILEIRKTHPELPVFAISGGMHGVQLNFLPLAKKFGACRIFEKPVSLSTLLTAVQELIGTPVKSA